MRTVEFDIIHIGRVCRCANQTRDAGGPFRLTLRFSNQILPDFDQHMRQAVLRAVTIEAITLEGAGVRLVIADNKPALGAQSVEQWSRQTIISVPQDTRVPGPRHTAPTRRKAVDRQNGRHGTGRPRPIKSGSNSGVIRLVKRLKAMSELCLVGENVHVAVCRNDRPVGQFHHQRRIICAAIEVDQQTRIARKHRRAFKGVGQPSRDVCGPDVISDMAGKFRRRETQRAIALRQGIGGMVADNKKAGIAPGPEIRIIQFKRHENRLRVTRVDRRIIPRDMPKNINETQQKSADLLKALYAEAVRAALPAAILPAHLPPRPKGRLVIIAIGKAAASMAAAAERHYSDSPVEGIALTRHGHAQTTLAVEVFEAGHPVPDAAGVAGSTRIMDLAATLDEDDLALVLISGGGSALATLPIDGVSLADKQALTRALLASGAPIRDINTVRKHLSRIKGGRLATAIAPARLITLAISDVAGDDPAVIASGPTVPDQTTKADALALLHRWKVPVPQSLIDAIERTPESAKPGDTCFEQASYKLIASGAGSLDAAAKLAAVQGYEVLNLGDAIEGEARDVARAHAALALAAKAKGKRLAILSGGEVAVTFASPPTGQGGPNQEYVLALAIALNGASGIAALAGDTDGIDGGSGAASDPAGAMIFDDTLARTAALSLDPQAALEAHDSGTFFNALGDLLKTGPSFTNVNDFRVILVG